MTWFSRAPGPGRHKDARSHTLGVVAVALAAVVLAASCVIQTEADETTDTTIAPPTTEGPGTTLPPEDQGPTLADAHVTVAEIADYEADLVDIGTQPGSESTFVASRDGFLYEIKRDSRRDTETGLVTHTNRPGTSPFLNISAQVNTDGEDYGLHGFAFSSDGSRLYVSFTNGDGDTQVDELRVSNGRVSPTSQRTLLIVDQEDMSQNAGSLAMGPDGFLHIPIGDGGGRNDPFGTGQDPTDLRGSILRIDPESGEGTDYNIPFGNPYDGDDGAREVYIIGVRHPSSIAFDQADRSLWVTDQGQDGVQELHYVGPDDESPLNFGWSSVNGDAGETAEGEDAGPEGHVPPLLVYDESAGCGIVGGAVYRNVGQLPGLTRSAVPGLQDSYIYGDHCTGHVFAIQVADGEISGVRRLDIELAPDTLNAIDKDPDGEIVLAGSDGRVYSVVYAPPAG